MTQLGDGQSLAYLAEKVSAAAAPAARAACWLHASGASASAARARASHARHAPPRAPLQYSTSVQGIQEVNPSLKNVTVLQPCIYVNVPPFPGTCVGNGNVVDVPGSTTVPAEYDYNGLKPGAATPSPPTAPTPTAAPSPSPAPVPSPSPKPVPSPPVEAPPPAAAPSSGASPVAAASMLAAVLAMLAGAVLL